MVRKSFAIFAMLIAIGAVTAASAARAADQEAAVKAATAEAGGWLKLIDDGKYGQSWSQSSSLFRSAITKAGWASQVKAVRAPLGAVQSRKLKMAKFETQLPGAPDGKYVVIQYDTSFANKKTAVETVTPMLDTDGHWRVSGYYIR